MTAFKLKKKESEADGIRRVAHERAEDAVERLRDEDADQVEAVHEARKDMKKLRATLKLVRPVIGDQTYRRENERFRDAGRALSDTRDAQVRLGTIDALAKRFPDEAPGGDWWQVRAAIADGEPGKGELEDVRERTAIAIEHGDVAIDDWPLERDGFKVVRPGLRRAYARARKAFGKARKQRSDEALHEWRKRAKDLWYALRLVRRGWPPVLGATADEAHELSDLLGDDHDLAVLVSDLDEAGAQLTAEQRERLHDLVTRRRAELQEEAFAYGERLLAEKPKRFVRRVEDYWKAMKA
jgi:CHAD domain-containing protein